METIRNRVAGLDVHRDRVVVCVRLVDGDGRIKTEKRSFSTMTVGVGELAEWLVEHGITTAPKGRSATRTVSRLMPGAGGKGRRHRS